MSKKLTFQEIILTLQQFWNDQGCMLMQAYDNEKGAGTMSPYTFLRAIGPEPWNAAYVEPSRRPADGRYGENPNCLYQHHLLLRPMAEGQRAWSRWPAPSDPLRQHRYPGSRLEEVALDHPEVMFAFGTTTDVNCVYWVHLSVL